MYVLKDRLAQREELKRYSVKELEDMTVSKDNSTPQKTDYPVTEILSIRKEKLNDAFQWTQDNILRLREIDRVIISAFVKAKKETAKICKQLKQRVKDSDDFLNYYDVSVKVLPYAELDNIDFSMVLHNTAHNEFNPLIDTVPLEIASQLMSPGHFDMYLEQRFSILNIDEQEPDNVPELKGIRFAMGMRELCFYSKYSLQDILKISKLEVKVTAEHRHCELCK